MAEDDTRNEEEEEALDAAAPAEGGEPTATKKKKKKKKKKKVRLRRLRLDPRAPPARLTALYPHAEEGRRFVRFAGGGTECG